MTREGVSVYSMFIAACVYVFGDLNGVVLVQHLAGIISVGIGMILLRSVTGSRIVPLLLGCALTAAVSKLWILVQTGHRIYREKQGHDGEGA